MKLYLPNILKLLQCRTKSFIQRNLFTLGPFKCTVIILQSITNKLHNSLQNFINSSCLFSLGQNTITTNIFSIVENNKSLCKERYKIDYTTQIFELIHQQFKALFHKFLSIILKKEPFNNFGIFLILKVNYDIFYNHILYTLLHFTYKSHVLFYSHYQLYYVVAIKKVYKHI